MKWTPSTADTALLAAAHSAARDAAISRGCSEALAIGAGAKARKDKEKELRERYNEAEKAAKREKKEAKARGLSPMSPPGFSATNTMPVHEGWLRKRGAVNTSWRSRWFSLDGTDLAYSSLATGKMDHKGVVSIHNARIIGQPPLTITVQPKGGDRAFILEAEEPSDYFAWLTHLTTAAESDAPMRSSRGSGSASAAPIDCDDVPLNEPVPAVGGPLAALFGSAPPSPPPSPPPPGEASATPPAVTRIRSKTMGSVSMPSSPLDEEADAASSTGRRSSMVASMDAARSSAMHTRPCLPPGMQHLNLHGHGHRAAMPPLEGLAELSEGAASSADSLEPLSPTVAAAAAAAAATSPSPRTPPPPLPPTPSSASAAGSGPDATRDRLVWLPVEDEDAWVVASVERNPASGAIVARRHRAPPGVPLQIPLSDEQLSELLPAGGALDEAVEDLTQLEAINTASVLHALRRRYEASAVASARTKLQPPPSLPPALIHCSPLPSLPLSFTAHLSPPCPLIHRRARSRSTRPSAPSSSPSTRSRCGLQPRPSPSASNPDPHARRFSTLALAFQATAACSPERLATLTLAADPDQLPPHVFNVARSAYTVMLTTGGAQSILISGESGAGKTESAKLCMGCLAQLSCSPEASTEVCQRASLIAIHCHALPLIARPAQAALESSLLLEAFGNAKTVYNENSSRFGKWVEVHFDQHAGTIRACVVRSFLLELSRVVTQSAGERNYHIFYQLAAAAAKSGVAAKEDPVLALAECGEVCAPDGYAYARRLTSIEGVDDAAAWRSTQLKLAQLGFDEAERRGVARILAAVLALGNVTFSRPAGTEEGEGNCTSAGDEDAATRLGVPPHALAQALKVRATVSNSGSFWTFLGLSGAFEGLPGPYEAFLGLLWHYSAFCGLTGPYGALRGLLRPSEAFRFPSDSHRFLQVRTTVSGRGSLFHTPLTQQQCADTRDALAKALYLHLFDWLVSRLNERLSRCQPWEARTPTTAGAAAGVVPKSAVGGDRFVGLLDIFGFENFAVNSLEQLCINFANEKLQSQFILALVASQRAEYA